MSIWFDKLGNKYADANKSGWLKAYTDRQTKQLNTLFTKHAKGEENRHTGEMIDYTASKTVTKALDETNSALSRLNTTNNTLNNSINQLETNKANVKANSDGGFCAGTSASVTKSGSATGKNASATAGGAAGQYAATETGGSIGMAAKSKKGFAGGQNTTANNGACGGSEAVTEDGGAFGTSAKSVNGFAGGQGTKTSDGVAIGKNARCTATTDSSSTGIDAIQLGTGNNTAAKSMKVYNYTMMNANGNIPMERMQLLNDDMTAKINHLEEILINSGLLIEEVLETAGSITNAVNANISVSGTTATPFASAPANSVSLIGETVDTSSFTTVPYTFSPGTAHTFTACLHGVIEENSFKATKLYITENPPPRHQVSYWDNTFDLILYVQNYTASNEYGEGYYGYTSNSPFQVTRRKFQSSGNN